MRVQNAESSNASFKHKSNAASPSATGDDGLLETLEGLERLLVRRTAKAKLLLSKALMAGQSTSEDYRARLSAAITSVHGSANLVHGTYTIETPAPSPSGAEATNITVQHATERGRTIKVQFDLGTTEFHSRVRPCARRRMHRGLEGTTVRFAACPGVRIRADAECIRCGTQPGAKAMSSRS